ncbi:hypothetical protein NECAME_14712 [Necator americanus]|uniref:Uncharacterized protein n=1 Tax=Necator americanus TaxID=51031 RepID=W2SP98_NECAM|nr:hypothetical protein NECAME_14712 [Necator americanus]ETN70527.1 hypothetical protein NECAME_14712 [Necator americanus]
MIDSATENVHAAINLGYSGISPAFRYQDLFISALSQEDIDCLYRELRVTKESHNVRVYGELVELELSVDEMMIGMTKPLRRFRATRTAEDGELTDSDGEEEEGQIKQEKGDDVAKLEEKSSTGGAGGTEQEKTFWKSCESKS